MTTRDDTTGDELDPLEQWLAQFDACDRQDASELVDSLTLVSTRTTTNFLQESLTDILQESDTSIACFASSQKPAGTDLLHEARDKPPPITLQGEAGSEALVAHAITQSSRAEPRLLDHPSLNAMKRAKVRDIVVLDDAAISGATCLSFLEALRSNPTLRSWTSSSRLRFWLVVYQLGSHARARLTARWRKYPVLIRHSISSSYGQDAWGKQKALRLRQLCTDYSARANSSQMRKMALGYKDTFSSIVFEHGCPNNTPSILWCKGKRKSWNPLFPGRVVRTPLTTLTERAARASQAIWDRLTNDAVPRKRKLLEALIWIGNGIRRTERLASALGVTEARTQDLLKLALENALITGSGRLTDSGRAEVRATLGRRISAKYTPPCRAEDFYFPTSLRKI